MKFNIKTKLPRELGVIFFLASILFGYIWVNVTQSAIDFSYQVPDPTFRTVGPLVQWLGILVSAGIAFQGLRIIFDKPTFSVEISKSKKGKK